MINPNDDPLYPDDVLFAAAFSAAVSQDIHEGLAGVDAEVEEQIGESQEHSRIAAFKVLDTLTEAGVERAEFLGDLLTETASKGVESMTGTRDMFEVSFKLRDKQEKEKDVTLQAELEELSCLAEAVAAVALAKRVVETQASSIEDRGLQMQFAEDRIEEYIGDDSAQATLKAVIDDLK